jgi:pyrroline-5-carboxylate reductase
MTNTKICIIGGGNLGSALALGLRRANPQYEIIVTRRNLEKIHHLEKFNIKTESNNVRAASNAQIILLALKPFQIAAVLDEIKPHISSKMLISLATGISVAEIRQQLGETCCIARAMPNTSIQQAASVSCIYVEPAATASQKAIVTQLFESVGSVVHIDERLFDAATVLGACGIAYVMRFIRAMMQGGIQIGFDSQTALNIAAQTVKGAAGILLEEGSHPEHEIDKVTTPRGCTIAGLNEMEHQGFSSALIRGIQTSYQEITRMKEDV